MNWHLYHSVRMPVSIKVLLSFRRMRSACTMHRIVVQIAQHTMLSPQLAVNIPCKPPWQPLVPSRYALMPLDQASRLCLDHLFYSIHVFMSLL